MFTESAQYYDLIYSAFKDYAGEAAEIAAILRAHDAACRTVLDVACGTGEHARCLAADGFLVDGLDLDPVFVDIARQKHRAGRFVQADMGEFRLGRTYDAILCLFGSIGYVRTLNRLQSTLLCVREHLAAGGLVIVEPWFEPGVLDPARIAQNVGEREGLRVTRTARVEIEGRLSRLRFDYEIVDAAGSRHTSEVHELGLFTQPELLAAFNAAGFEARHDPAASGGRGRYLARPLT